MEKKTIVPEKSKKRAFIENLIFCILIIIAVVGSVCAWAIVVSKSEEIITNESMQFEEDTQKDVYYDTVNNISYNDNLVSINNYTSYNETNKVFYPQLQNRDSVFYGLGGNSLFEYYGSGTDYPLDFNSTYIIYDDNDEELYYYDCELCSFSYSFDNSLLSSAWVPNRDNHIFLFYPLVYCPNDDLYDGNFESHYLCYTIDIYGYYNNDTNLRCLISLAVVSNFEYLGDNNIFYGTVYNFWRVSTNLNFYYDLYNGFFRFDDSSSVNNLNVSISSIDFTFYLDTQEFDNELNCNNLNGCSFGLVCYSNFDYLYLPFHNYIDIDGDQDAFISYLPNYFKFVNYSTYQNSYNSGYNNGFERGESSGYDDGYDVGYGEGYDVGFDNGTTNGYANGYQHGVTDTLEQVGTDWFTTNNYVSTISFDYIDDYGGLVPLNFQFDYGSDSVGSYINFTNLSYQQGYTNKLTIYFNYAFLPKLIRSTAPFSYCFNGTASVNVSYFGDGIYGVNNDNLDKFGSDNYISLAWDNSVPNTFKLYIQGFSTDIASYEEFFNKGFNQGYEKGTANGYQVGYNVGLQNNNFIGNARLYLLLKYHLILLSKFGILKF